MGCLNNIGIVIRTYNEVEMLPQVLSRIMEQTEQSCEIAIVDSGSTDATLQVARSYSGVKIIEISRNEFTYGKALNIGISSFKERIKYAVLLSAHAVPFNRHWLRELIAPLENDSTIAGVYGKQIPLPQHLSNPVVSVLAADAYRNCYGFTPFVTNKESFFSNANRATRYDNWKRNKFDESIWRGEDWQWAKVEIEKKGLIAYQPSAAVYHSHPMTFRKYFQIHYREVKASREIDANRYPVLKKSECFKELVIACIIYLKESFMSRSLCGLHWDRCRVKTVEALAAYSGRKDARIT